MPKRGRPGGSRSARGGKSANHGGNGKGSSNGNGNGNGKRNGRAETAPQPVPPAQAPPTEGLLANAAPPADQVQLIPLAPLPQETEGLLGPTSKPPSRSPPPWPPPPPSPPRPRRARPSSP